MFWEAPPELDVYNKDTTKWLVFTHNAMGIKNLLK